MKTVAIKQATLDSCVGDAQSEQVVVTRNGKPVALIVGLEHLDVEARRLTESHKFWSLIAQRRSQKTISRAELEKRLNKVS
jgi:antitoxin (DNA-binding transcriptional repressor) of toxin-antitoxin stability system